MKRNSRLKKPGPTAPTERRRRVRRFHTYRKKSALVIAVEQAQLATEAVTRWWLRPFRFVAKKIQGSGRILVRSFVYLSIAFLAIGVLGIVGAMVYLSDSRVQEFLVDSVRDQTGGELSVSATDFGLFRGVEFTDLAFTPAGEKVPLLKMDAIQIKYQLWKLVMGRLQVDAVKLVHPALSLRETSGVWNFQSVVTHREKNFPSVSTVVADPKPLKLSQVLPVNPRGLFMPLSIAFKGIGISDLEATIEKNVAGDVTERVMVRGAGADVGFEWKHRHSLATLELGAIGQTPMVFQKTSKTAENEASDVSATMDGRIRLNVRDFFDLALSADIKSLVSDIDGQSTPELGGMANVAVSLREDLSSMSITRADIAAGKFFTSALSGEVSFPHDDLSSVRMALTERLALNLDELGLILKKVVPDLVMSGGVRVDDLRAEGTVNLKEVQAGQPFTLPHVNGAVHLENIEVSHEPLGFLLLPTNGIIGLSAGPDITGKGSQIEATSNVNLMGLHLRQKTKNGEVSVAVDNLFTGLTARMMYPEFSIPVFKLNIEAEHVIAGGGGLNEVDAPLYISINADAQNKLKRAGVTAAIELKNLLDAAFMAECQDDCRKVRTTAKIRIDELSSLYAVALPVLLKSGNEFVPRSLAGGIDIQASGRGVIPAPLKSSLSEILRDGDVKYDAELSLTNFSAQIPRNNIAVENYEARLRLDGTLKSQRLQLQQALQKATVTLPPAKRGEPVRNIAIERLSWETELRNKFSGMINLEDPLKSTTGDFTTKMFVGRTTLAGILPRPVNGFEMSTSARLVDARRFFLNQLSLALPDMGTSASLAGEVGLDSKMMPENFKAKLELVTNPGTEDAVPGGIKMSGRVAATAAVESKDMDNMELVAGLDFSHYSIKIPAADEKLPARLVVENINGQLPISRKFSLKALSNTSEAPKTPKKAGTDTLATATDEFFLRNDDDAMKNSNAMAIMDFGSVRPTFAQRKPISIEKIEVANLELSRMEIDLEVRQDWISLNQFVIGFLGGKIQGSTHFAFDDKPRAVKAAIHMTRLDTHKLVEKFPNLLRKTSSGAFGGNPYIDAVMHLDYDFKSNDMAGGLEIASIGKEQLRMILFYIDPKEENQTIRDIRRALTFGEVRQVSVPIKNGQIGLEVDVRILTAPIPVPKLSRFPLSQLVQNMTAKSTEAVTVEPESAGPKEADSPAAATIQPPAEEAVGADAT